MGEELRPRLEAHLWSSIMSYYRYYAWVWRQRAEWLMGHVFCVCEFLHLSSWRLSHQQRIALAQDFHVRSPNSKHTSAKVKTVTCISFDPQVLSCDKEKNTLSCVQCKWNKSCWYCMYFIEFTMQTVHTTKLFVHLLFTKRRSADAVRGLNTRRVFWSWTECLNGFFLKSYNTSKQRLPGAIWHLNCTRLVWTVRVVGWSTLSAGLSIKQWC